jgi:hypothetical protein
MWSYLNVALKGHRFDCSLQIISTSSHMHTTLTRHIHPLNIHDLSVASYRERFTVFRLLTDFVCLYNYEFWLSLCKIVRSSVILLLPLLKLFYFVKVIVTSTYLRNNYRMPGSMLILTWAFMVILCLQAYLDRSYFGRCSNYLPLLFTRIYNATETL